MISYVAVENLKNNIASFLFRAGLSANFVSGLGLFFAVCSGLLIYQGLFLWAAIFLLAAGISDLMDGAIARSAGIANSFGGILDSTVDRYGDGFVWAGVLFYGVKIHNPLFALFAASGGLGSFAISYVRARAECAIENCRVGFWERGERIVYVALGLALNNLALVLIVLGVGTHLTAFYRLLYVSKVARNRDVRWLTLPWGRVFFHSGGRGSTPYKVKAAILFLAVCLIRINF